RRPPSVAAHTAVRDAHETDAQVVPNPTPGSVHIAVLDLKPVELNGDLRRRSRREDVEDAVVPTAAASNGGGATGWSYGHVGPNVQVARAGGILSRSLDGQGVDGAAGQADRVRPAHGVRLHDRRPQGAVATARPTRSVTRTGVDGICGVGDDEDRGV